MRMKILLSLFGILIFFSSCTVTQITESEYLLNDNLVEIINTFKSEKSIFSSPIATKNDNVIIGGHDKNVYFFNKSGNLISKFETDSWVHASPSIMLDGSIAIGSYDGNIYFFDENGNLINTIKPDAGSMFTSVVELPNRLLMFGSNKKGIVFFDQKDSTTNIFPVKKWSTLR